jgi:hypothetical protein
MPPWSSVADQSLHIRESVRKIEVIAATSWRTLVTVGTVNLARRVSRIAVIACRRPAVTLPQPVSEIVSSCLIAGYLNRRCGDYVHLR